MGCVILLYGPKAVGKSWIAERLQDRLGVHYLDADELILDLLATGGEPDPDWGWLAPVFDAATEALTHYRVISVEATGAWDSDWKLAEDFEQAGVKVLRIWVIARLEVSLERLRLRTTRKVPTSESEARAIYRTARRNAAQVDFDLTFDTTGQREEEEIVCAVANKLRTM